MIYELEGFLYDGLSSQREEATLVINNDGLVRCDKLLEESIHLDDIAFSSRVGNTARYLDFGENRRFETLDNDTVDSITQHWKPAKHGLADRLEHNMLMVLVAIIVVAMGSFAFVTWGIPALSKPITALVPDAIDQQLGHQTMAVMDNNFMSPSTLDKQRRQALRDRFSELTPADKKYRLLFRSIEGMPNAFAVPGGTIVMTDALVELSENDEQLASILLHEIGHLEERHSVQTLVQHAGLALVVTMLIGDVSAASSFLLALPSWLAEATYSQALETEADDYAFIQMQRRKMNTAAFADIMLRLENSMSNDQDKSKPKNTDETTETAQQLMNYLSSHPPTKERIKRFQQAGEG